MKQISVSLSMRVLLIAAQLIMEGLGQYVAARPAESASLREKVCWVENQATML